MTRYTVQCCQAYHGVATLTVEADSLDLALARAVAQAARGGVWQMSRLRGPVFVDGVALGDDADLTTAPRLDIPRRFTEGALPLVIVTVSGGLVQDVQIKHRNAHVAVHDYDIEGCDPQDPHLRTDDSGDRYLLSDWSYEIPADEAG